MTKTRVKQKRVRCVECGVAFHAADTTAERCDGCEAEIRRRQRGERKREYMRNYHRRPEVRERDREYRSRPEVIERRRERHRVRWALDPEYRARKRRMRRESRTRRILWAMRRTLARELAKAREMKAKEEAKKQKRSKGRP